MTRWAANAGRLVIEDDYDGEFRYDRQPLGAIQALAPDSVAYVGTASKSLAPGLRLGWLALPDRLVRPVAERNRVAGRAPSVLEQLTLADLISSGAYDRHVRRRRLAYRRRRDRLLDEVARAAPWIQVTGIAAGLHALLELPAGRCESELVERAAARGLAIEGLSSYCFAERPHDPALAIGYGTPPEHAYEQAIRLLGSVLQGAARPP